VFLDELEVRGIRNLKPQRVSFRKRVTVISGRNGQGKTSLLEAIFLLSHHRSFRTSLLRDVVSWADPERSGFIRGLVRSAVGSREIRLELDRGRRVLLLDGKRTEAAGQFFGQLRCVTFTPEELQLVKGAPQMRRQYVDRTLALVDREYFANLVQYQRALKQRNSVLGTPAGGDDAVLVPWERLLAEHGRPIAAARSEFLSAIAPSCAKYYRDLCGGEPNAGEKISFRYRSDFSSDGEMLSQDEILALFEGGRGQDCRLKATQLGVHRDDVEIVFGAEAVSGSARSLASQGQSRTIALALKLAAVEYIGNRSGEAPIILLDDAESELDAARREGLFEFLQGSSSQVIITTTDPSWAPSHSALDVAALRIEACLVS
jgi:DNA replication and repair protein RecF